MKTRKTRLLIVFAVMLIAALSAAMLSVRPDESLSYGKAILFMLSAATALGCATTLLVALAMFLGRTPGGTATLVAQLQRQRRSTMSDDKSKTKQDRKLVASGDDYEVADFAKKYGVPPSEAATIIKRYGPSRKKLDSHMASRQA